MRFSQSTYLLMCLSLKTLTSIIKISEPILLEIINDGLGELRIILLSPKNLLRWLTFLLGSLTRSRNFNIWWYWNVGSIVNRFREPIFKMVSTKKGFVKLTIGFVVGFVNGFCCCKSKEILNSFLYCFT